MLLQRSLREAAKGVPRKNLRSIAGRPLLAYAIAVTRQVPEVQRVIVSTDNAEIAEVARSWGAEVPFLRPPELATDQAPELLAWQHAVSYLQEAEGPIDLFVAVPTVCPLRRAADIRACIDRYDVGDADIVMTAIEARANPYYTLVELDSSGAPRLVKSTGSIFHGRQQAPKVLQLVAGCYVASPSFVLRSRGIWSGNLRLVEIPVDHGVDIDSETDFALA